MSLSTKNRQEAEWAFRCGGCGVREGFLHYGDCPDMARSRRWMAVDIWDLRPLLTEAPDPNLLIALTERGRVEP